MLRVLAVEDDIHSRELLTVRLEALGCEVLVASNADEGILLAEAELPDVILLDLKLSGGSGVPESEGTRVMMHLRENPATAAIPVVIHSIYVRHPNEAPQGVPAGDFLLKPFKVEDLKAIVDKYSALAAVRAQ